MQPVLSVGEMQALDAAAQERCPIETLVQRAGTAVEMAVVDLLRRPGRPGSVYGKRAIVVAGKGHNGDDGRTAALRLRRRGMRVAVVDVAGVPDELPGADVVIDAAYGTGFRGTYVAPKASPGALVVAVDVPSGLNADTGERSGAPMTADRTVTFVALKPGLLLGAGPALAGSVTVADIGIEPLGARAHLVEDADVYSELPRRDRDAHKWRTGVAVVAGSPGMMGSAVLCAHAAARAGAGMVRLGVPGCSPASLPVSEAVSTSLASRDWSDDALAMAGRCRVMVAGPGLGRDPAAGDSLRRVVADSPVPVVVDGDGLWALGEGPDAMRACAGSRSTLVLTPHDGEATRLARSEAGADRIGYARDLSTSFGAVVLLKGPCTVIAEPSGQVRLVTSGSSRLATAGSGDVLSGLIGAFIARGLEPFQAAALGAHVHGRAASLGLAEGLVAGDLADLVARWLSGLDGLAPGGPDQRDGHREMPR